MSAPDEAVARAAARFEAPAAALDAVAREFTRQMARGLVGEPSSLKMLRTFTGQPLGRERGRVVVVDWGGTRGRAALVELAGADGVRMVAEDAFTFSEALKRGPAEPVFDAIAAAVERVIDGPARAAYPLAFAYSYPARLEGLDRALALPLTKGWRLTGLEGRDVAALLNHALRERGLGGVAVRAVANDTVAALVLQSYRARAGDPGARPAAIGLILGTGTNLAADLGPAGIRNLESGNFDGVAGIETPYDAALDRELTEPARGAQRFEKMVSGHYLGEILRRVLEDLGSRTAWFRWAAAPAFATPFGLDGEHLSGIAADETPDGAAIAARLRGLGVESDEAERRGLRDLGRMIGRRAARLIAAVLLGTLRFLDREIGDGRTIAVDGSLWGGYPGFEGLVRAALAELIGPERAARIEIAFVKDSTSAGAAVIAAVAAGQRSARCSSA